MTSYEYRRPPTGISTINIDVDDIDTSPREEYRHPYRYEQTTSSNSEKRKSRWCLITLILFLIIVSLLSIVAVIIAIYSLVLNTNKTAITTALSTSTVSTIASVTSTNLVCSSSPTTSYLLSTATPSQCSNYTNNTDSTRNIAYTQSINYCDNISPFSNATSVWIRFLDPAGTIVSNSPVSPNSCGTVATGWYAGQYPITFYTTATSLACFYYTTNTCAACSLMSVTNCRTFYVFLLPMPDDCNYRYCTL